MSFITKVAINVAICTSFGMYIDSHWESIMVGSIFAGSVMFLDEYLEIHKGLLKNHQASVDLNRESLRFHKSDVYRKYRGKDE
jgi:uncharacterized membrane protein YdbT with pleckstrin-like domain